MKVITSIESPVRENIASDEKTAGMNRILRLMMKRRNFLRTGIASVAAVELSLVNQLAFGQRPILVEGETYLRLQTPQPRLVPNKVDVVEFFSYACPHCSEFEPTLEGWLKKIPQDVTFRRIPVPFLANAANFQKTYFALEQMGLVEKMQLKVFAAVHAERRRLDKPEDIVELVGRNGGDAAKFLDHFRSFSVATALNRANKMTIDYDISKGPGVPALVVDGRYLTSPAQAGNGQQALAVVDALIQLARKGLPQHK